MGQIFNYTGNGGGKTTNALGVALRCLGHNKKVAIIQFLKWYKETGEFKFKHPNYKIFQCGRKGWKSRCELGEQDSISAVSGLMIAGALAFQKPDLLILDELNLAVKLNLVTIGMVKELLKRIPEETTVFITGREAPQELMDLCDYVIEVNALKTPKDILNTKGINY